MQFDRHTDSPFDPYYVSPWQNEGFALDEPVLQTLRGDFFCMPFGEDNRYEEEAHPVHGEPASSKWTLEGFESQPLGARAGTIHSLEMSMQTQVRPGNVRKRIHLVDGENVVYVQQVLEGYTGPMTFGHHATLRGSEREDALRISTSPLRLAMTAPKPAEYTSGGEYYALEGEREFESLDAAPTVRRRHPRADLSRFPRRRGFVDIAAVFQEVGATPAWTAAFFVEEGYLWFALKDPRVLPATVFWMENHGRHQPPWNGRNCCLGLEDVCGYFSRGLAESARENALTERGIPTVFHLSPDRSTAINYIEGGVRVPRSSTR
ncbi:MAG: hypothetical protein ACLFUM_04815 [Spirochaetaceae bacterium]